MPVSEKVRVCSLGVCRIGHRRKWGSGGVVFGKCRDRVQAGIKESDQRIDAAFSISNKGVPVRGQTSIYCVLINKMTHNIVDYRIKPIPFEYWNRTSVFSLHAVASTYIRFKLNAMVTSFHSPDTASSPLRENCRKPITCLIIPNTGSTVHLRRPYNARPFRVFSS